MLINRRALSVHQFTSTDETRTALHNIRLNPDGSTEATNGHYLVRVSPNGDRPADDEYPATPGEIAVIPDEGITIPAANAKSAEKAIDKKAGRKLPTLEWAAVKGNAWKGGQCEIVSTDLETVRRESFQVADGQFPNTDQIRDTRAKQTEKEGSTVRVSVDARLLSQICAFYTADRGKGRQSPIILEIPIQDPAATAGVTPILITGSDEDGTEIEAILMPMRI